MKFNNTNKKRSGAVFNSIISAFMVFAILFSMVSSFPNTIITAQNEAKTISVKYYQDGFSGINQEVTQTVEDREINFGRIQLKYIEDIAISSPDPDKVFIGWKDENGEHYIQGDYCSLPSDVDSLKFTAVWGYTVYVSGTGHDVYDGQTEQTAVRTMGRAYELLAQRDSNNPNGNINGLSAIGNSTDGYTGFTEDTTNQITDFNGRIVVVSNFEYKNETEGRYQYITYGDLKAQRSIPSETTVTFNDGVSTKTFTSLTDDLGYDDDEPVRLYTSVSPNPTSYRVMSKTASGYYHYMLKKVMNDYSYTYDEGSGDETFYTYGRLIQYTQSLRTHTSGSILTPKNDGFVMITSNDGMTDYQNTTKPIFMFSDFTRYACGSDTVFKNINLIFLNLIQDTEESNYVGGLAANGYYLAMDEGVSRLTKMVYNGETINQNRVTVGNVSLPGKVYSPNIYGGNFSYRWGGYLYSGPSGNNLGDFGQADATDYRRSKNLPNTRLTIKSGLWSSVFGGAYGLYVGEPTTPFDYSENNAAVLNLLGGQFTNIGGAGHEGAYAYNTYVYLYDFTGNIISLNGSGVSSSGSLTGGGRSNVLINTNASGKITDVFGGSANGVHQGDTRVVLKNGNVTTLYGGSRDRDIEKYSPNQQGGNIQIIVTGGTISNRLIGGGKTGAVEGKVSIDISGGTIGNGTGAAIYCSGAGSTATAFDVYYQGPSTETNPFLSMIRDRTDPRFYLLLDTADSSKHTEVMQQVSKARPSSSIDNKNLIAQGFTGNYHSKRTYTLNLTGIEETFYYPHIFNNDYSSVITGYRHTSYDKNLTGGQVQYTVTRERASLSLATVKGGTEIKISGNTVNTRILGDVYGGGEVAVVEGNTNIEINGGMISGNVYGGGNGTVNPTVNVYVEEGDFTQSPHKVQTTRVFQWAGEETFDIEGGTYSPDDQTPIKYDYNNTDNPNIKGLVYSPNFKYMGAIDGNTSVTVAGGMITGNVYGGGLSGNVTGNSNVKIDGNTTIVNGDIFGGGSFGVVGTLENGIYSKGNATVYINNGAIFGSVYGGAEGIIDTTLVYGLSTLNVTGGTVYYNIYGGSKLSNDGTGGLEDTATLLNITGGNIKGSVFGGGYYGLTTGSVHVHIGLDAINVNCQYYKSRPIEERPVLSKSELIIGGNVYAGGDWGTPDSPDSFDHKTITGMAHIDLEAYGYNTSFPESTNLEPKLLIEGSLYASGNSCDASGNRRITVRNYGERDINNNVSRSLYSIQRADFVEIFNSNIELIGQSDATSSSITALNSIKHIDSFSIMDNTLLVIQSPTTDIDSFHSLKKVTDGSEVSYVETTANEPVNSLKLTKKAMIIIYDEDTDTFGPVRGYTNLIKEDYSISNIYARIKDEVLVTGSGDDGGFIDPNGINNSMDDGYGYQIPYYDRASYRYWKIGDGNVNYRDETIIAKADSSLPDEDILKTTVTVAVPAANAGSSYFIRSVTKSDNNFTLAQAAYKENGIWISDDEMTVSMVPAEDDPTVAAAIATMQNDPGTTFGFYLRTGDGFDTQAGSGLILSDFTIDINNNLQKPSAIVYNEPTDGAAASDQALPRFNFTLTYSNAILESANVGEVKVLLEVGTKVGDVWTPLPEPEFVEIAITITTQSARIQSPQNLTLYATQYNPDSTGGKYTGELMLPPVGYATPFTLNSVSVSQTGGIDDINLVSKSSISATGTNEKDFAIEMAPTKNSDNTNGWKDRYIQTPYDVSSWSSPETIPVGETDGRFNSTISFTIYNNGDIDFDESEAGVVTLKFSYEDTTRAVRELIINLHIVKIPPSINATVPLYISTVVHADGRFTVPGENDYGITSTTPASLTVSKVDFTIEDDAFDVFSDPSKLVFSINSDYITLGNNGGVISGSITPSVEYFRIAAGSQQSPSYLGFRLYMNYPSGELYYPGLGVTKTIAKISYTLSLSQ